MTLELHDFVETIPISRPPRAARMLRSKRASASI